MIAAPPSLYLVCCFCHGPILVVKEGKRWNHVSSRVSGHEAMPEPEDKHGKVVKVKMTADRIAIWDDARKTLTKEFWLGPYAVMNFGDIFSIELTVEDKSATEVLRRGYECGLGRFGYVRVNTKKEEDSSEGSQAPSPTTKRVRAGTNGSVSASASSEVKGWWQCPNPDCKRHIKSGPAFHFGKSAKCLEYAKAKGISVK